MPIRLFEDLAAECNAKGWFVLNCFQVGDIWRVNLQRRASNGTTESVFTEFADAKTPSEALRATMARMEFAAPQKKPLKPVGKPSKVDTLPDRQAKRLTEALDCLIQALERRYGGGA